MANKPNPDHLHLGKIWGTRIEKQFKKGFDMYVNQEEAEKWLKLFKKDKIIALTSETSCSSDRVYAFIALGSSAYYDTIRPSLLDHRDKQQVLEIDKVIRSMDFTKGVCFFDMYKIVEMSFL